MDLRPSFAQDHPKPVYSGSWTLDSFQRDRFAMRLEERRKQEKVTRGKKEINKLNGKDIEPQST